MSLIAALQARWRLVSKREQGLLQAALALVLLALLWWLALAPALATLKAAQTQRGELSSQLQQMQRLQAQAKALQAQPRIAFEDARRLLEAALKPLGASVKLGVAGERVTLTLKGASPDALAQALSQARLNAHAVPSEARLVRSAPASAASANAAPGWDGTLVLVLVLGGR
jgi:general secretion pathway protein M